MTKPLIFCYGSGNTKSSIIYIMEKIVKDEEEIYLKIKIEVKKKVIIVKLKGELDHHTADEVRKMAEECINEKGYINVVFDFSELDFMDSSGIGLLVGRYKLLAPIGGKVCVVTNGGNIERIIKMSGIEKLIGLFNSTESAICAVSGGERI